MEDEHFPDVNHLRASLDAWTWGLVPAVQKWAMQLADVPDILALTRSQPNPNPNRP